MFRISNLLIDNPSFSISNVLIFLNHNFNIILKMNFKSDLILQNQFIK